MPANQWVAQEETAATDAYSRLAIREQDAPSSNYSQRPIPTTSPLARGAAGTRHHATGPVPDANGTQIFREGCQNRECQVVKK